MINFIKRLKIMYAAYNFFHKKELYHNELVFKKLGISKKYFSSISSRDFESLPDTLPLENGIKCLDLSSSILYAKAASKTQESLDSFQQNGFAILPNYLSIKQVDAVNAEIEEMLLQKKLKFTFGKKIMFAIHESILLRKIGNDEILKELLSVLLKGEAVLFQSINFLKGSEQLSHSDSIHMTTYPLGGLLGVWIALEDINEENGPLHYYPGSQNLPYYLNKDYDNVGNAFLIGDKFYTDYEKMMRAKINEQKIEKSVFYAKKGDLFIWHANLFHGGEPHLNKELSRKSMVLHYFKKGSVCYHEITQRPALIKEFN